MSNDEILAKKRFRNFLKFIIALLIISTIPVIILLALKCIQLWDISLGNVYLFFTVIIIVAYFVWIGKVSEIKWGSVEIKIKEVKEARIEHFLDRKLSEVISPKETIIKGSIKSLFKKFNDIFSKKAEILKLDRKERYTYSFYPLYIYLSSNLFKYVVFTDGDVFHGFVPANILFGALNTEIYRKTTEIHYKVERSTTICNRFSDDDESEIIQAIRNWDLSKIPGISKKQFQLNQLLKDIFEEIIREDIDSFAVVDTNGNFKGIVSSYKLMYKIFMSFFMDKYLVTKQKQSNI